MDAIYLIIRHSVDKEREYNGNRLKRRQWFFTREEGLVELGWRHRRRWRGENPRRLRAETGSGRRRVPAGRRRPGAHHHVQMLNAGRGGEYAAPGTAAAACATSTRGTGMVVTERKLSGGNLQGQSGGGGGSGGRGLRRLMLGRSA